MEAREILLNANLQVVAEFPKYNLFNYECVDNTGQRVYVVVRSSKTVFSITQKKIERLQPLGRVYLLLVSPAGHYSLVDLSRVINDEAYRKENRIYIITKTAGRKIRISHSKRTILRITCNPELRDRFQILKIQLGLNSETLLARAIEMYDRYTKPLQKPIRTGL